ncbi:LPXTG cell wall anchor domain-containing protein [Streptomyces sp. NBC_01465]|uniref:LPXTG cell wall anchor domain-containing protein n=1 Tax=Streptomyces sp. NBC_01465 TaxID=2903878 RepID=UPI002E363C65|nr:LPXTG cell wall anchor domain-containing protein [Streptomyces sp. NBC_01465]
MKLRHVMAVAAATAVMSAPLAYADEPVTPTPSATESGPATTESATPTAPADATPSGSASASASPSDSASGPAVAPSPSASASSTPSAEPSECPLDEDGIDLGSKLELGIHGLPGKIVAGSGWHTFSLRATNTSDQALGYVEWALFVDNDSLSEDKNAWLSTFTQVQYWDAAAKKWTSMDDDVLGGGAAFGETELGPKQYVDLKLRLNIGAKAPKGDGFSVGFGGYLDSTENCFHDAYAEWDFTVLAPGSGNENPGQAKPGKGTGEGKTPQGGITSEVPATGSLASTGSSSMVPTIGIAAGIAVALGAGTLVAVRRRKDGSAA